jgi:hypothetical protein
MTVYKVKWESTAKDFVKDWKAKGRKASFKKVGNKYVITTKGKKHKKSLGGFGSIGPRDLF